MANVTISIDQDVVRRARARAAAEGTSLSAVVGEMLEKYAGRSDAADVLRGMFAIADASGATIGEAGVTWTRDELYDRANVR